MSEIVPSTPDERRITIRSVSRSPRTSAILLIAAVVLAVLWRATEGDRVQLAGERDAAILSLETMTGDRDTLNRTIGELESSLQDEQNRREVAQGERDTKARELETVRADLGEIREQLAANKVIVDQLEARLVETADERDTAIAERDEARKALAEALNSTRLDAVSDELKGVIEELNKTSDSLMESENQLADARTNLRSVTAERDNAVKERDTAREDHHAASKALEDSENQLADVQAQLDSANEEIQGVRGELETVTSERDELQTALNDANERITALNTKLDEVEAKLNKALSDLNLARGQLAEVRNPLVLYGDLQERSFPNASFFRANGTIELEAGVWVFVTGDIGGHEATRAGDANVTHTVVPSDCVRELEGDWPGILTLDCPAVVEWIVESRYPQFLLNILQIENLVMQENVEQSTEGE